MTGGGSKEKLHAVFVMITWLTVCWAHSFIMINLSLAACHLGCLQASSNREAKMLWNNHTQDYIWLLQFRHHARVYGFIVYYITQLHNNAYYVIAYYVIAKRLHEQHRAPLYLSEYEYIFWFHKCLQIWEFCDNFVPWQMSKNSTQ